jgi:hypothetical protein
MLRIALGAACVFLITGQASAASTRGRISLHAPPTVGTSLGRTLVFTGTVAGAPGGANVVFERHSFSLVGPGRWETLAASPIRRGRFRIVYRGSVSQGSRLRFAVMLAGRLLLAGREEKVVAGEPPWSCERSLPPPAMVSRGMIVGAIIRQDGTPLDTAACGTGTPRTVSVQDATGRTVAEESIAGLQSFVFLLQPGTYSIHAGPHGECTGSGTVGETVIHVDAICPATLTAG